MGIARRLEAVIASESATPDHIGDKTRTTMEYQGRSRHDSEMLCARPRTKAPGARFGKGCAATPLLLNEQLVPTEYNTPAPQQKVR